MPEIIHITWRNGAYYVSRPNWNGGAVVPLEDHLAEVERLNSQLQYLRDQLDQRDGRVILL